MAIDRNKIIEAATKYVQKGQFDKAIREYSKLSDADPKDARIQQKLGELYQKKGDNLQAGEFFLKVAETYAADGFFLKAVAVFKQVLRLNPNRVEVNLKLAELHQQLGLVSDAMVQYQLVANHYEKAGNTRASLETLHKMVELDPDNVASRIKLAELYARQQMNSEAIVEFQAASEYLKKNSRIEDYLRVAERLSFLDPGNLNLTRELAQTYLSKQDTKRALAKLQICFKANPRDVDTLQMLARVFDEMEQTQKTVSVYRELTRIFAEQNRAEEEKATWKKILELAPDDAEALAVLQPPAPQVVPPTRPKETVARSPANASSAIGLDASSSWVSGTSGAEVSVTKSPLDQVARLLTETEVYAKYGLREKALDHIQKILAMAPDCVEAHEKAISIHQSTGDTRAMLKSIVEAIKLLVAQKDLERAHKNLEILHQYDPTHPQIDILFDAVRELESLGKVNSERVEPQYDQELDTEDDAILLDPADEELEYSSGPPPYDIALEHTSYDEEEGDLDGELVDDRQNDDPALAAAEQSLDEEYVVESAEIPPAYAFQNGSESRPPENVPIEAITALPESIPAPNSHEFADYASDELDEATFYVEQGMPEEAQEILDKVLLAFPDSIRARELYQKLQALSAGADTCSRENFSSATEDNSLQFDLASELAEDFELELPATDDFQDFQYSVEDVLGEFKKGLKNVVKPEDVETHYDLGIAYKEMGLLEEAIGEFEQAATAAVGAKREVECLAMMGVCRVEREKVPEAIEIFQRCLFLPQITLEMAKSVHYELGLAYEKIGHLEQALKSLREVERVEPGYRELQDAILRVQQLSGSDLKEKKSHNIGYV